MTPAGPRTTAGASGWERAKGLLQRRGVLPALVVLLALAVYVPGLSWGIPHATGPDRVHSWGNDDLVPLAPLAEMHNTFVEAKPDRNIAYPWFHYFVLATAYAPYLGYLYLTGGLELGPGVGVYPFGLADPVESFRVLTWIGKCVNLGLGLVLVLGAYALGKILWDRRTGVLTALFAMLLFPMAYYARVGNLDMPVLAYTALGLAAFAHMLRHGITLRNAAGFAVAVALAAATKDQAGGSFLLLIPVVIWLHARSDRSHAWKGFEGRWLAPATALVAGSVTYILASGIPVDPQRWVSHIQKIFVAGTQAIYTRYPGTAAGYAAQATDLFWHLVDVMGAPLLLLVVLGGILLARDDRRPLLLLLSAVGFVGMLLPVRFSRIHYLLPVALPLTPLAAYAVHRGIRAGGSWRAATIALLCVTVGQQALRTADLTYVMVNDARYEAGTWLAQHTVPGDAILYFGAALYNPPIEAGVQSIHVEWREDGLPTVRAQRPAFVIVTPDDTNQERKRVAWRQGPLSVRSDYVAKDLYEALVDGSLGYRLVGQFQSRRLFPWLDRPFLSYGSVNPPILIFARKDRASGSPELVPWATAPHNPRVRRVNEPIEPYLRGED